MTLEPNIIIRRLQSLRETLRRLEPLATTPRDDFVADFRTYWAAGRGIQLAAEAVLDIASHFLAGHFDRFPETNEESLDALLEAGVIAPATRARLRGFGGVRVYWCMLTSTSTLDRSMTISSNSPPTSTPLSATWRVGLPESKSSRYERLLDATQGSFLEELTHVGGVVHQRLIVDDFNY
ncbi:DUF86 domain-containing protein [Candidatus Thiodictyon syntrophicum]|jgi:hypothetical protein|uniref:DUF86 domain-containing protein n=1 Tax=Candidatus Thiodictyon syntrophicum TaxID=1166950 RepID=A0A2K8UFR6_9GAMM|nr:HepT-like ribonuclease domain-containing protein [Candidatus Thiodictyon syntrophicum]AUB84382.1 hypothetical protein THSYN_27900 [Candidatus Thiodictyon syntrophicum]